MPKVKFAPAHLRSRGSQLWPGRCAYCGRDAPGTVDHVIPGCLYPAGWAPNEYLTVPSHRACNEGFSRAEGLNGRGLGSYLIGVGASVPFMYGHYFHGPIGVRLESADISYLVGFAVAAAAYLVAGRRAEARS